MNQHLLFLIALSVCLDALSGCAASLLIVAAGLIFASAWTLMASPESWAELWRAKSIGGAEAVLKQIRLLEDGANQKSDSERKKDKELQTILELVYEMNLRGIPMLNVDIYKSAATRFLIEGDAIRPPFNAIPGVGGGAAEDIVARRKPGAVYPTIEDFARETGANSGIVASLEQLGCFAGMPKKKQISLFDF